MQQENKQEVRPELKELTPETVRLIDLQRFPTMTGWFEPLLLLKLVWRVIVSDLFGQYADRRLMEAALDTVSKDVHLERADLTKHITPDKEGAVWIDYVSDLGDGFDATYAIAYLLAHPSLVVDGHPLPRGEVLVMGGDQVYPTSLRDDYKIKTLLPYSFALPDVPESRKIPLLVLPGNHDWYDGLITFLAIFCREKPKAIGRWNTVQRRSYFAAKLTETCWIWGIDIALVRDMDQPQADYFVAIAESMPKNAKIILCSSEPGWYSAEGGGDSWRTLSYAAWIAENAGKETGGKNLKVPLVLSGDSHHYARYSGSGAQYVTSGGGGGFLHGTIELKETITAKWLKEQNPSITLQACYPSKEKSHELLKDNRRFGTLNPGLTTAIAAIYTVISFILVLSWKWEVGVILYIMLCGGLYGYARYQEGKSRKIGVVSLVHGTAHMAVVVTMAWLVRSVEQAFVGYWNLHWLVLLAVLIAISLTFGRWLAGKIFGYNLLLTCRHFGLNNNDAFSSMRLDSFRHFLRIRILGDRITLYPIKVDHVPNRDQWRENSDRKNTPSAPVFVPEPALMTGLIEAPIEITTMHAQSTEDIKTPKELPKDK